MIDLGKKDVLGVQIDAVDYEAAVEKVIHAAKTKKRFIVSALAVHGIMTGVLDKEHLYRLNTMDLAVPDGQPVRWYLNNQYKCGLADRVYGPELTLKICQKAAENGLPIFLYGSRENVLEQLKANLLKRFPDLSIAGVSASTFRNTTKEERFHIANRIHQSGARIVFVGLGCPRQEVWIYEYKHYLAMPLVAVGAAFDFHAGLLPQAPSFFQRWGFEWLYRLYREPRRLWKRYLYLNTLFIFAVALKLLKPGLFSSMKAIPPENEKLYG